MPDTVTYAVLPTATRFILQGTAAREDAASALGFALPETPMTSTTGTNDVTALWLGPDEWLILDQSGGDPGALRDKLAAALAGVPHSLVDVSQRQIGIAVAGAKSALALNAHVPLDLNASAFPVDRCTRTVFEKCEIVLWRRADDQFYLETGRSFVPYVTALLDLAAAEIAADVGSLPFLDR